MDIDTIPEPIASFIDAVNRHDEPGFLDAFGPGGAVDDWGRVFEGRDAIKAWSDREFIGARGTFAVEGMEVSDATVTLVGDWRSQHANGPSKFTFDVDGDRITRMTIREG